MTKEKITINGLMEGVSVIEKDNVLNKPHVQSDILYNDAEPFNLKLDIPFHDEVCEFTPLFQFNK